jgi:hypothetical protein
MEFEWDEWKRAQIIAGSGARFRIGLSVLRRASGYPPADAAQPGRKVEDDSED